MSGRNRPRGGQSNNDADEERNIWNKMRTDAKKVDSMRLQSDEFGQKIVDVEQKQANLISSGKRPSASLDRELEALYRQNSELCRSMLDVLEGPNDGRLNIMDGFSTLAALREASQNEPPVSTSIPMSRSSSMAKSRQFKRKHDAAATTDAESAADSPASTAGVATKLATSASRLVSKGHSSRAGSVAAATRDVSVKIEESGSVDSNSVDGDNSASSTKVKNEPLSATQPPGSATAKDSSSANSLSSRAGGSGGSSSSKTLAVGTEVFCRNKQKNAEGVGILCHVTSVLPASKNRSQHQTYEVQDAEPDIDPVTGQVAPPYRASAGALIPIPNESEETALSILKKGAQVLALYPATTTFYRAEVSKEWRPEDGKIVRLRFEGEDEAEKEMDAERRFVLIDGTK